MTTARARALVRRLGQYLDGFSACFSRQPQRDAASQYLDGLLNDSERKSMQAMQGRLSESGQYQALQHFITHSPWKATHVWTQLRAAVPVRLGILALDDTGFPKQGTHSVGVQRQYCGALGKIGNCQLKPSGVLAVCIDQRELFRLGQMLDELFREQNRIAIINWQRSYTRTNDAANVATTTEYLLVHARDLDKVKTGLLPRKDADGNGKAMPDNDPRPWVDGPATGSNAKAHKSMVYAIQSPFTGKLFYPPMGSAWRAGQEQNLKWLQGWGCKYVLRDIDDLAKRATSIGVAPSAVPSVKAIVLGESLESASKKARALKERGPWPMFFFLKDGFGRPRLKTFVEHLKPGYVPTTFWASDDFSLPKELGSVSLPHHLSGHSEQGVDELTAVVGSGHEFKTVKPLKLFQQVVDLWSPKDGLILDPFAGTGTTAHAALALNAMQGAARRFIMIEQGRPERGDSYARTLTSKRLQRAVSGKWANRKGNPLGGGFEFVTLEKTVDAGALLKLERDEMVDTIRRPPALSSGRL